MIAYFNNGEISGSPEIQPLPLAARLNKSSMLLYFHEKRKKNVIFTDPTQHIVIKMIQFGHEREEIYLKDV